MNFTSETIDNILIVTVSFSKATINMADKLKDKLLSEISNGHKQIVVDLCKVEFTDSSFLGALLAGHKTALENEGGVYLCKLNPQVKNVFEVTYMNKIFKIFDTIEKAIENFKFLDGGVIKNRTKS